MTALDIIVIVVVVLSAVIAFFRGMVKETLSLAGWIAAALAVLYGLPHARPYARQVVSNELIADAGAGVLIFIVVLVIFAIISSRIGERVRESSLGLLDRSLGLLYGVLRGFVLVSLGYLLLKWAFTENSQPDWIAKARTKPVLEVGAGILEKIAPEGFIDTGKKTVKDAKDKARDAKDAKDAADKLRRATDPKKEPGYDKKDRDSLDKKIDSVQ